MEQRYIKILHIIKKDNNRMKYLQNKKARRRGVAIELAVMLMLVMTAMSTIIVSTTMIHINKQKNSQSDLTELKEEIKKMEYDQIGQAFQAMVKDGIGNEYEVISARYENYLKEKNYSLDITSSNEKMTLTLIDKDNNELYILTLNISDASVVEE